MSNPRWGTAKKFKVDLKRNANARIRAFKAERDEKEREWAGARGQWGEKPLVKSGPKGEQYALQKNGTYQYIPFTGNSRNTYWVPRNERPRRQGNIYIGPPPQGREYGIAVPNRPPPPPPPPPSGIMTMANEIDPNAPPLTLIPEPVAIAASRKNRKNRKTRRRNRTRRNRR